jgi:hypothetical protein
MTVANVPCPSLRVAFYGRVACDADGTALTHLAHQYEQCRSVLPPDAITAILYDIGKPANRCPWSFTIGDQRVNRSGSLDDLLTEATNPARRFDQLITYGPDRHSPDMRRADEVLRRLTAAGVEYLIPTGATVEPGRPVGLVYMRLVAAVCTEVWRRAAEDGDPR